MEPKREQNKKWKRNSEAHKRSTKSKDIKNDASFI